MLTTNNMDTNTNSYDTNQVSEYGGGGKLKKALPLIGIVMLIFSVSAYALFVRSEMDDYSKVKADISTKSERVAQLKKQIDTYKETEKKMDLTTEVQKKTLINSIPVGVNQDGIIEDLVKIASENDVKLKSVSFGVSRGDETKVGVVKMNASFEGNYNDLLNFLEGIEENARFFKVTSISVQVNDVSGLDIKRVTFSLSLDAYYQ